ncbi:sensor histidine kinase [Pseudonocardia lacus]|uniref:sensor histidine kinase n=1 Tax=Pseudonocardia lacus TaxID=2835865 RepID=UPI001BDCF1CF|nr:nitrate- and nitrite sensing domain-containing protein [Pseudonocardia lacus]
MRFRPGPRTGAPSLRTRLLAGVMIPSTLVLVAGAVVGVNLISTAVTEEKVAEASRIGATGGAEFFPSLIVERGASLLFLAAPTPGNRAILDEARTAVDDNFSELRESSQRIYELLPPELRSPSTLGGLVDALPALRSQVDARSIPRAEVTTAYSRLTDVISIGTDVQAGLAQSAASSNSMNRSGDLHGIADRIDKANSVLIAGLLTGDLARQEFDDFVTDTGAYRGALQVLIPRLTPAERERIAAIQAGPEWQLVSDLADAVIARGFAAGAAEAEEAGPLPDLVATEAAARSLARQFMEIGFERRTALAVGDAEQAQGVVRTTVIIAVVSLVALVAAFLIALSVTTRVVRRLTTLRRETLELAETSLPDTVARLRKGERLDLDEDIPTLDHGDDEIGQVAAAFNKAQRTAVEAAVEEAHTREGFNAAFLNIARRSQAILHQQMQVLDRLERAEPDPDQLEMLFSLDHLATRERRNAENLIILGGEQPRRQWRNPVALGELVRAAVGESEHYQRVTVGGLPQVMVDGSAVGDLVHLIAELVDNATAFSPPGAPIEVHGTIVGRGVVVEVEDQGLGIAEDELVQLNDMLRNPPDFGLFTLSRDSRIGLFVVARLARRHNVTVTLRSSAFGGIRAGLLVPTAILAGDAAGSEVPALTGVGATGRTRASQVHLVDGPDPGAHRTEDAPTSGTGVRVPAWAAEDPGALPPKPVRRPSPDRVPDSRELVPETVTPTEDGGLPRLPRRRRQAHMDSRLLAHVGLAESGAATAEHDDPALFAPTNYSPETARSRMSALRRGTAQARAHDPGPDDRTEGRRT